jgi:hypothetical protein
MAFINMEGDFCEACAKDLLDNGLVVYSDAAAIDLNTNQRKVAEPSYEVPTIGQQAPPPPSSSIGSGT